MSDVYCDAHFGEMKTVTQSNQGQRNDMMNHKLLVVFAWLFQLQHQDNGLRGPVTGLKEIVRLEHRLVTAMGESLEHCGGVEVPERALPHHVKPEWPKDGEIYGRVDLLHEACLLGSAANVTLDRERPDETLHEELAREAHDHRVEQEEADILLALAIHHGPAWIFGTEWVRQEECFVYGILLRRIDSVACKHCGDYGEREEPRMPQTEVLPFSQGGAGLSSFRVRFC